MTHISQEELLRKIVQENPVEEEQASELEELGKTGSGFCEKGAESSARPAPKESAAVAHFTRLVSGLGGGKSEPFTSSSKLSKIEQRQQQQKQQEQQQEQLGSGKRESQTEMSSILPRTGNQARDSNNNSAPLDEDEIQAVLITGCGSKIGSNIAVAFAERGLKVALADIDMKQTEAVARECQEKSPRNRAPLQIVADISQLAEAHKLIDRTIEAFGRLDVLVNTVNNASLIEAKFQSGSGDDDSHVFEQYHKIIASNMHSVTYLCLSAAPYLRKTKGSIVNVSSITNSETSCSYKFAYCMSKAGISTLTKCLATDLAPDIKVICVSPKSDSDCQTEIKSS